MGVAFILHAVRGRGIRGKEGNGLIMATTSALTLQEPGSDFEVMLSERK